MSNSTDNTGTGLLTVRPTFNDTLGALLLGCYFAIVFYGLVSHQVYRYYKMYPRDHFYLKVTVGLMWTFETLHSILITHVCYFYTVTNFLNPLRLADGVWSLRISLLVTAIIITVSHVFFARRVHLLLHKTWITASIMLISAIRLAFTIGATIVLFETVSFETFEKSSWLLSSSIGLSMGSDLIITISLCFFLKKCKTGFERTDDLVDKLLLYAINTGLLTIIFNAVTLICATTMARNMIFIGLYFATCKLYTNSLLAVLNSRDGLRREGHDHHGSFILQEITHDVRHGQNELVRRRTLSTMVIDVGGESSAITPTESGDMHKKGLRPEQLDSDSRSLCSLKTP